MQVMEEQARTNDLTMHAGTSRTIHRNGIHFFTTKEIGVGTGQGLALSYDFIVNKHCGEIKFKDDPCGGTEFIIKLPLDSETVEQERHKLQHSGVYLRG